MKKSIERNSKNLFLAALFLCMLWSMMLTGLSSPVSAESSETNHLTVEPDEGISCSTNINYYDAMMTKVGVLNNHMYARFASNMTWSEAKKYCEALGGHLVTITSQQEQQWLFNTFNDELNVYWIGCYPDQNNNWKWITRENFNYNNWSPNEPDSWLNNKDRGTIYTYDGGVLLQDDQGNTKDKCSISAGQWAFIASTNGLYFICEWDDQSTAKPDTRSTSETTTSGLWADPVDTATGAHVIDLSYLTQYGDQTFSFDLSYDSSRLCEGEMGTGWYHCYEKRIEIQDDETLRYYTTPSTYVDFDIVSADKKYYHTSMPGKEGWYIYMMNGYFTLHLGADGDEYYYPGGTLRGIKSHTGQNLWVSRTSSSMTITDAMTGKALTLTYDAQGRVAQVTGTTPEGTNTTGAVSFTYDSDNHLTAITGPDNKTIHYTYDANGHVLTGTDGDGICYFTDTYENGRISTQADATGHSTSFAYEFPDAGGCVTTVTDRNGNTLVYTYNVQSRLVKVKDQEGKEKAYAYDAEGNVTRETDGKGNTTVKTYNDNNQVLTSTDPLNQTTQYTYDSRGNLLLQENPDGGEIVYTYRSDNQVSAATDERGNVTTYTYTSGLLSEAESGNRVTTYTYENGKTKTITDPEGGVTTYTYTASGMPSTITDANGKKVSYSYDAVGNLVSQTVSKGDKTATTSFSYDSRGNLVSQTDAKGNTTAYEYNGNGKVTSMTDAKGNKTTYAYDGEDRLTETKDPQGNTVKTEYTKAGLVKTTTDADNHITSYTYDGAGNVLTEKAPKGGITTNTYDANNNLATEKDPAGNITTYTYDSMGRLTKETNALGKDTVYHYNDAGDLLSVTDPLNHTTSYTYDANGNQLTQTDPNGNITTNTYDANNNLTSRKDALNNTTAYSYDLTGQLVSTKDANNNTTTYTYDEFGRITGVTDPLEHTTAMAYDANGNVTSSTDANGNTTSYTYDQLNLQTSTVDPLGNTTHNTFDSLGRLTQTSTPSGRTTRYTYDDDGNMLTVSDLMGNMSSQAFDSDGNVTEVTNPNGQAMGASGALYTSYDTSDRKVSETATGGEITYGYNSLNVLSEYTNGRGQQTTLTYDDAGRITHCVSVEGTTSYTYDANGNVLTVTNPEGTVTRQYDALNRMTSYTDTQGNTITYTYDKVGNLKTIDYPGEGTVTYTYDAANQMKTVTDWNEYVTTYTYDNDGNLIRTERPDGSVLTETYDTASRLSAMEDVGKYDTVISGYNYTYDADGNIIEERSEKTQTTAIDTLTYATMTYDAAGRLTVRDVSECQQNILGQEDYLTVDAAGNLTEADNIVIYLVDHDGTITTDDDKGVENSNISMVYGWHNHLVTYDGEQVSYDHDGNMINGPLGQMTYDSQNRLTAAGDESYTYDGEDNRISSTVDGDTTTYTYDTTASLSRMLMSETGTYRTYYIYGIGLIGSYDSDENYSTYHYDYRGSTVALTDENGTVTDEYIYGIYGEMLQHTGNSDTPFLYNGRDGVMTDDNGLCYMRARYYSPVLMRFVNADPLTKSIEEDPYQNAYAYANGNPISYIDPFGTSAELGNSGLGTWLTQNPGPLGEVVFYKAGFIRDANGIYHTRQDALQQYAGYNSVYDMVFDIATSMESKYFQFVYNGQDYRFWAWKGDYLNLGAGAELGIYTSLSVYGDQTGHWIVDTSLALPMTMTLSDNNGNLIATYDPSEPQWWITSFNPYVQGMSAGDLSTTFTVDFSSNAGMFNAFSEIWDGSYWKCDPENHTATLIF